MSERGVYMRVCVCVYERGVNVCMLKRGRVCLGV